MISLTDGITINLQHGPTIIADGRDDSADYQIISHAHTDHLAKNLSPSIICSQITAALIGTRTNTTLPSHSTNTDLVTLIPSGHILGSRAALIDGTNRILYTGDLSTRDRYYLDGFTPPSADILIIEATYGIPTYEFPDQSSLETQINNWITANSDCPLFLFGYSLGRAQKLHYIANNHPAITSIFAAEPIKTINQTLTETTELTFSTRTFSPEHTYGSGDAIILPTHYSKHDSINVLIESTNGIKAGFSGWAVTDSYRYRGGYDITFPLSDHCDFSELINVVKSVDPDRIYTHHGFSTEFATHLAGEHDYDAQPLLKNQTTLTNFS
jgi:putative mRNA 3-end processing factor